MMAASAPTAEDALDRAVKGIRLPVRVGELVVWFAIAFYARGNDHEALWIDVVLSWIGRPTPPEACRMWSGRCRCRAPFDEPPLGPLLLHHRLPVGLRAVDALRRRLRDGSLRRRAHVPRRARARSAVCAVHRKPVRPGTREVSIAAWTRPTYDDSWRVSATWYPPARPAGDWTRTAPVLLQTE